VPYLKNRLVLKGGTALNLFYFDQIPRLSVDIDLNYIGQLNRADMMKERPLIHDAIQQIMLQNQYEQYRNPSHHAGDKMVWRYPSLLGQKGNLEIDLNYMYRQPLWPVQQQATKLITRSHVAFPVLDIHELAAGKLSALLTRTASRDLFDAHHLLTKCDLDNTKLRFAFVVYLGMTELNPDTLSQALIQYDAIEIRNRLLPVSKQNTLPRSPNEIRAWAEELAKNVKVSLGQIIPLHENELDFISQIRNAGKINASLITDDIELQNIVNHHPALLWAAQRAH